MGLAAGCSSEGLTLDTAPASELIYVFYPSGNRVIDGLVRGRGLAGSMPAGVTHARIESYPTARSRVVEVGQQGGFEFEIIALSGDVLEIRAAASAAGEVVGPPAYIRVPASIEPFVPHVCCPQTNTCQDIFEREAGLDCPDAVPGIVTCEQDFDCAVFEGEYLPLDPNTITLARARDRGVTVEGQVLPNVLVTLSNIGKSSVAGDLTFEQARERGLEDPGVRLTRISDAQGRFRFESVPAIADDEIVIQLFDLRGFRSPPYAQLVPDPSLAGVDVLGVFPWEPLTNGAPGRVAVRLSPFGPDGRGICPDRLEPPDAARDGLELCVSGGLEHGMVRFNLARLDRPNDATFDLNPVATSTDTNTPHNRGVEGNVRSEPLDLFVVLDVSNSARSVDPTGRAIDAIRSYVRNLRQRDRVGLMVAGVSEEMTTLLEHPIDGSRQRLDEVLAARAAGSAAGGGPNALLDGISAAAAQLGGRGRIVAITFGLPRGTPEEQQEALEAVLDVVERQPEIAREGYPVDVVSVQLPDQTDQRLYEDLTTFSRGRLVSVPEVTDLEQSLADLRGEQVGSFILLYTMDIPLEVGKAGTVFFNIEVTIPGSDPREESYEGPLRIANVPNQ